MRSHNNPIWTRSLQQASGIKHRDIAPTLAPEIQPVVIVEDLTKTVDSDTQPRFCWGAQTGLGGDGLSLVGFVCLRNPAGSGVLMRVKRGVYACTTASTEIRLTLNVINPAYGNGNASAFSNSRISGLPAAGNLATLLQDPAGLTPQFTFRSVIGAAIVLVHDTIISPGFHLQCWPSSFAAASLVTAAWEWDEISIGPRG